MNGMQWPAQEEPDEETSAPQHDQAWPGAARARRGAVPARIGRSTLPSASSSGATLADLELVARIQRGDVAAFETLVRSYHRPLHTFLTGFVRSAAVADDLLQDLFLNIWKNRSEWHITSQARGYLYTAARNAAMIYQRHERIVERFATQAAREEAMPAMSAGAEPTERRAEATEIVDAVDRALARLPERCRMAATLRLQHSLTYAETAQVMGITVKAVERLYTRALRLLRTELTDYR
jgi:RNA polymerase sigma-70 factor (ECF subfamily)